MQCTRDYLDDLLAYIHCIPAFPYLLIGHPKWLAIARPSDISSSYLDNSKGHTRLTTVLFAWRSSKREQS